MLLYTTFYIYIFSKLVNVNKNGQSIYQQFKILNKCLRDNQTRRHWYQRKTKEIMKSYIDYLKF